MLFLLAGQRRVPEPPHKITGLIFIKFPNILIVLHIRFDFELITLNVVDHIISQCRGKLGLKITTFSWLTFTNNLGCNGFCNFLNFKKLRFKGKL